LGSYAWWDENAYNAGQQYAHTVAGKRANTWGLYDMHGNVYEWCQDVPRKYEEGVVDPHIREGSFRVFRGGSWYNSAQRCRSALRSGLSPDLRNSFLGFRLVSSLK
jgi:formylglycine-generating enzyme required for sulfatase activity